MRTPTRSSRFAIAVATTLLTLALAGCGTVSYQRATIDATHVANPTIGIAGISYDLPPDYVRVTNENVKGSANEAVAVSLLAEAAEIDANWRHALGESYLFQSDDRFIWTIHLLINFPINFRSVHPMNRPLLLRATALEPYRGFHAATEADFDAGYDYVTVADRDAVRYKSVTALRMKDGAVWRTNGYGVVGDLTEAIFILGFAATPEDFELVRQDVEAAARSLTFGAPRSR